MPDKIDLFIAMVSGYKMTGATSLIITVLNLSGPMLFLFQIDHDVFNFMRFSGAEEAITHHFVVQIDREV